MRTPTRFALASLLAIGLVAAVSTSASAQTESMKDPARDGYTAEGGVSRVGDGDLRRVVVDFGPKRTVLRADLRSLSASTSVMFLLQSNKKTNAYVAGAAGGDFGFYYSTFGHEAYPFASGDDKDLARCIVTSKTSMHTGKGASVKLTLKSSCIAGTISARAITVTDDGTYDSVDSATVLSRKG